MSQNQNQTSQQIEIRYPKIVDFPWKIVTTIGLSKVFTCIYFDLLATGWPLFSSVGLTTVIIVHV